MRLPRGRRYSTATLELFRLPGCFQEYPAEEWRAEEYGEECFRLIPWPPFRCHSFPRRLRLFRYTGWVGYGTATMGFLPSSARNGFLLDTFEESKTAYVRVNSHMFAYVRIIGKREALASARPESAAGFLSHFNLN